MTKLNEPAFTNQEQFTPKIFVETIKLINKGSLRAFATVAVAGMRIHGVRIIQQDSQNAWVALPQTEIPPKTPTEKKKYFPVVEVLDPTLKDEIQGAVLEAYRRATAAGTPPVRASIPPDPFRGTDEDIAF